MKKLLIALAVLFAFVWGAWFVAIPTDVIFQRVEATLRRGETAVGFTGCRKGLFYSVRCEAIDVRVSGNRVFSVSNVSARLRFLPLLTLKAVVPLRASAGGGEITGSAELTRQGYRIAAEAAGVEIEKLGLYPLTGLNLSGALKVDVFFEDGSGKARFSVDRAEFESPSLFGFKLPLELFHQVRGALLLNYGKVEIESLALEGEDIYARVTGSLKGGNADLKLELMPEGDTFPDPMYDTLLQRYRVSRGHYVIPVKSRLNL